MTELELKKWIGILLALSHSLAIVLLVYFFVRGGVSFKELTITLGLVAPILAAYTPLVIRFFSYKEGQRPTKARNSRASGLFIMLSLIPFIAVGLTFWLIYLMVFNRMTFEEFTSLLSVVDLLFAGYVGYFIQSIFGEVV